MIHRRNSKTGPEFIKRRPRLIGRNTRKWLLRRLWQRRRTSRNGPFGVSCFAATSNDLKRLHDLKSAVSFYQRVTLTVSAFELTLVDLNETEK